MPQSYVRLYYHLIFSTKHREPLLIPSVLPRLYEYIGGLLRTQNSQLLAAGGMPDHVHLLVMMNQLVALADALRGIKASSSKWIHDTYPDLGGFAWQAGYGGFTVSHSELAKVERYLEDQEEHHRTRTFQEEYIAFLKRHGITYDERYLWD